MQLRFAVPLACCLTVIAAACGSAGEPMRTHSASAPRPTRTAAQDYRVLPQRIAEATPVPFPLLGHGQTLVVLNGRILDGTGADPIPEGHVVVADGRISSVGRGQPEIPEGATVIDARGGTIMPGLVDTHVHLTRRIVPRNPSGSLGIDPGGLLPWLTAGFTTLRDVGTAPIAFPPVKQFVDVQEISGQAPRVVWAGPMVTTIGGYPIPVPRYALVGEEVASAEEAHQVVIRLADGGAGVIKLGLEKGYYADEGWPIMPLEVVQAVVETAHSRGLRVTAHVTSMDELRLALDGGVDDLAHAPLEPIPDSMLQEMIEKRIGMATTATVWGGPGASAQAAANAERYADAGGIVSIATDFGCCDQVPGLQPYLYEMEFLHGAGMTPMQLIVAATRNGAILSNLGDDVGTIEVGKIADIIVVDGDPLADLQALNNARLVVHSGAVVLER